MISLTSIVLIVLAIIMSVITIHWVADFVLQTDWQAKNKSKNFGALLEHTLVYYFVWLITGLTLNYFGFLEFINFNTDKVVIFSTITFIFHTLTDYFTSRLNSKLWGKGDVHNFFVSIGFDQVLHYVQLFGTLALLILY